MAEYAITWSPLDDLFPSQELVYRWLHAYIQHHPIHTRMPVSYRISRRSLLRLRQCGVMAEDISQRLTAYEPYRFLMSKSKEWLPDVYDPPSVDLEAANRGDVDGA